MKIKGFGLLALVVTLLVFGGERTPVFALSGAGAVIDRVATGRKLTISAKTAPGATVTLIDAQNNVLAAAIDNNTGLIIFAVSVPEEKRQSLRLLSSDGRGITEKIALNTASDTVGVLLPPTIYQNPDFTPTPDALGFVGYAFPGATIIMQIDSTTNENLILQGLADKVGEWQLSVSDLPPGKYQAIAKATYGPEESAWSQILSFEVLNPSDRAVQNLGAGARGAIEQFTGALPEPAQDVVNQVNNQADLFSKVVVPAALTIGTLAELGLVVRNVLYFLLQAAIAIAQALGLIQKRRQWGVAYDAVTKRPLVRAIVRLYDMASRALIETDVTNKSGIFSFLPKPGVYYLEATKPGYLFPSQLIVGKTDGEYHHVYTGGEIRIGVQQAAVDVSVPLDPKEYTETLRMKWQRFYGKWIEPVNRYLLVFGALLAVLAFARKSDTLNFAVLWLYIFGLGFQAWRSLKLKREWGVVEDAGGVLIPGVEVTLTDVEFNRLVSRRITDERGRYQFVAPPGRYLIRVVTPGVELLPRAKGAYAGEEFRLVGKEGSEALVTPKIVVKKGPAKR